jgi:hypothetical protein
MSEPQIGEFLEHFDVQVSAGSLSNILSNTAASFEQGMEGGEEALTCRTHKGGR